MPNIPCYAETHPRIGRPETGGAVAAVFGQVARQKCDGEWECRRKTSPVPGACRADRHTETNSGVAGGAGSQLRTRLREAFPCFAGKYSDFGEPNIVLEMLNSEFLRVISILPDQFPQNGTGKPKWSNSEWAPMISEEQMVKRDYAGEQN